MSATRFCPDGINTKKLKDLSKSERPREKRQAKGPEALSDLELMAILLGSGTKGCDVLTVAGRIVKVIDGRNEKLSLGELQKIEGVGPAKASLIAAALEFARRRIRFLDHIVFNQKGYYSFLEKGLV